MGKITTVSTSQRPFGLHSCKVFCLSSLQRMCIAKTKHPLPTECEKLITLGINCGGLNHAS